MNESCSVVLEALLEMLLREENRESAAYIPSDLRKAATARPTVC